MKTSFFTIFSVLSFFNFSRALAQDAIPAAPCQQIKIATDTTKRNILFNFINNSIKNRWFFNNKGIISLTLITENNGNISWLLAPLIDDSYKDNPPTKFSDFEGDIILIYEKKEINTRSTPNVNAVAYNKCLEEIIGDRVYLRPTIKTRWTSSVRPGPNGTTIKWNRGAQRLVFGGGGAIIVRFNKDGTYSISPMS